jgi:uncharacterized protein YqgC (DUF456 family)
MDSTLLLSLGAVLVLVGLVGTLLPLLPGALLVFAGLFLAAWAHDFTRVGPWGLGVIGALGALSLLADFLSSLFGARRAGASPLALGGATVGALVGLFFGIPGLILGPFAGAVAGEFIARRELLQAGKVGLGTWIGLVLGAVAKLLIAFMMVVAFGAFYLMNAPA